jgi:hypothetical protein
MEKNLPIRDSVRSGRLAADANAYKSGTTPTVFPETRQVRCNAAGEYKLYLADAPTTAITITLAATETLDWAVVKIADAADDTVVAEKAITLIW